MKAGQFDQAAVILQGIVDREPTNLNALRQLAASTFMAANATGDSIDQNHKLDATAVLLRRIIELNPEEGEAYYTLGVIAWTRASGELFIARLQTGMTQEEPGPLKNFNVRQELRARFEPVIEEGIADLQKVLQLDGSNSDAMAYMNLLLRARADIHDTPEQSAEDMRMADGWVQKAMAAKKGAGSVTALNHLYIGPPPPPPPPGIAPRVDAIRVGGNVQAANLVTKVDPVYPPLAVQARVQGTVRLNVTISKEGQVQNITLMSGHPLLVQAATNAVQQWVYKPTLLNGQPVTVTTTADVNFTLPGN